MTQLPGDGPWEQPVAPSRSKGRRAAVLLWIVGALELVGFGCCAGIFAFVAVTPLEQLREVVERQESMPAEQWEAVAAVHPLSGAIAIALLLLGFLPGVIYLALAFGVWSGRSFATIAAIVLVLIQTIVLGIAILMMIAGALMQGDPISLTTIVLVFGTPLMLLIFALIWLFQAQAQPRPAPTNQDPWDLPGR